MRIFEAYKAKQATHCWFCGREYGVDRHIYIHKGNLLIATKEHIIAKSKIIYNIDRNYISSCMDCNSLKKSMTAKQFAEYLDKMIDSGAYISHEMASYIKLMRNRAWKLYNKTSYLHKNYKIIRHKTQ